MRARLTGAAAIVALAVSAAGAPVAVAQDPSATASPSPSATPTPTPSATPTPTPTPTPEEEAEERRDERDRRSKPVRRIYRDFERDGRIDDCDHTMKGLKRARRSIADSYKEDFPDFRDALNAAIERHRAGECVEPSPTPEPDDGTGGGTPPAAGGRITPPPPPPPPAAVPPAPAPESGSLPDFGDDSPTGGGGLGGGGSDGGGSDGGVTPLPGEDAIPEGTASPEPTPAPTPAPPVQPRLIVTRAAADPNLFVPGTLLAVALAGLLIAGLTALAGRRSERLAGVTQAWREAGFRASGTWHDFTDWLRQAR